jgi:hypothetical protein
VGSIPTFGITRRPGLRVIPFSGLTTSPEIGIRIGTCIPQTDVYQLAFEKPVPAI